MHKAIVWILSLARCTLVLEDVEAATDVRLRTTNQPLNRGLLRQLDRMLRELNPYASRLSSLGQQLERAERGESADVPPPQHFRLSILDTRPAPGQVFAVFDARDNSPPDPNLCGIYIYSEGSQLQKIANHNKNGDWILFPLMFPTAVQTYGSGILRNIDTAVKEVLLPFDDAVLLEEIAQESEFEVRVVDSVTQPRQPALMIEAPPVELTPIEPAAWDEDIENTDIDIPAAVVAEPEVNLWGFFVVVSVCLRAKSPSPTNARPTTTPAELCSRSLHCRSSGVCSSHFSRLDQMTGLTTSPTRSHPLFFWPSLSQSRRSSKLFFCLLALQCPISFSDRFQVHRHSHPMQTPSKLPSQL